MFKVHLLGAETAWSWIWADQRYAFLSLLSWITHYHPRDVQPKTSAHLQLSEAESVCREVFSPLTAAIHESNPLSRAQTTQARTGEGLDHELWLCFPLWIDSSLQLQTALLMIIAVSMPENCSSSSSLHRDAQAWRIMPVI